MEFRKFHQEKSGKNQGIFFSEMLGILFIKHPPSGWMLTVFTLTIRRRVRRSHVLFLSL